MALPPYWLPGLFAKFYNSLFVGGVSQPQEAGLDIIAGAGITVSNTDDAANGISHVTIAASGSTVSVVGSGALSPSQAGSTFRIDTIAIGSPVTLTLPAITQAMDGIAWSFEDPNTAGAGSWNTNALTLTATTAVIESPTSPGAFSSSGGSAVLSGDFGGSITYRPNYANQSWKKV